MYTVWTFLQFWLTNNQSITQLAINTNVSRKLNETEKLDRKTLVQSSIYIIYHFLVTLSSFPWHNPKSILFIIFRWTYLPCSGYIWSRRSSQKFSFWLCVRNIINILLHWKWRPSFPEYERNSVVKTTRYYLLPWYFSSSFLFYIYIYIYIRLKIRPKSIRIRF